MTGAPFWMSTLLFAWAIWECEIRFQVRPDILSWLLMSVMLWILEQRTFQKKDLLFMLPIIQVLWVNTEGLFILGLVLMAVYFFSDLLHKHRPDKKALRYSCLSAFLCLANPYFFQGLLFPFNLWKTLHSNLIQPNIREFMSPWIRFGFSSMPDLQLWGYKLFSLFLFITLLMTLKKRKTHEFLTAFIFFILSATAVRNIPLFILTCAPILMNCWKDLEWAWIRDFQNKTLSKAWAGLCFLGLIIVLCARVVTNAYYLDDLRPPRFGIGINDEDQPVQATCFLAANHLNGRILNSLNTGGWLDWDGPSKTFIDGRLEVMGESLFSEFISSEYPGKVASLADKYAADIIFFKTSDCMQWVFDLQNNTNWRAVYMDGEYVIYLRKNYAPLVEALDDARIMAENKLQPLDANQVFDLLRLPVPASGSLFLRGFYAPADYPERLVNMGTFYFVCNHPKAGEAFFLEAIRRSGGIYSNVYYLLGVCYYQYKRFEESRFCLEKVIKMDPTNPLARQLLGKLHPG